MVEGDDRSEFTTVWRVRVMNCDGGQLGKIWTESFFFSKEAALDCLRRKVIERNQSSAVYKQDTVEHLTGWCSWQHGIMIAMDEVVVQRGHSCG